MTGHHAESARAVERPVSAIAVTRDEGLRDPSADVQDADTPRRRMLIGLSALVLMLLLVASYFTDSLDSSAPRIVRGGVDYARSNPLDRPVELSGDWRLTWLGGAAGPPPGAHGLVEAPGFWAGARIAGVELPGHGHVRYDVAVQGLATGDYMLYVPALYAASEVYLNGRPVSRRGTVGNGRDDTRYHHRAQFVTFRHEQGAALRIGIEMAAFLHRDNGMDSVPALGLAEPMQEWVAQKWSREILYNISLLLVATLSFVAFLYRRSDRASLYFGLSALCFLPSVMVLGFDDMLILQFPALSFRAMLAIQYLSAPGAIVFYLLMAHELYRAESSRLVVIGLIGVQAVIFAAQVVAFSLGDTVLASHIGRTVFLPITVATLLLVLVIVARATWRGRDGALVQLCGMSLFVASYIISALIWSAVFTAEQLRSYEFTTLGAIMILYSQVVLMAERSSLAVVRSERMNEDLRQLLEVNTAITSDLQLSTLLNRIVAVTSKIIRADRSSLFLKDDRHAELATLVAQGTDQQLRVDVGRGLTGYVFATGETLNVPDAYADERFNRSVDEATGYRTKSVLSVPVTSRDGRRIGVMQALNRTDHEAFSDGDAARLSAFGAQAAVAIDNARLFSETVAARNFDESILRSMSGGVIALDLDWKITKLNAAAADILGASRTLLGGLDARSVLRRFNPRLVEEIAAVADRGEPKLLLDIEFDTARERPASVNLSITPLEGETGRVGVLLVIEDISEGKRLQGAMRRFMTQEVVDQVLGRDDDSLFGAACQASVLFADIRGFTTMAEVLSARETVETLNELFTELYEAVSGNGGVLDKYIGDAVMAVFGAPLASDRDPDNAFASGLEMLRMLDAINLKRAVRGAAPLRLGVGIATGEVVAGTIGSPKRMDYTVIGDSVNLAARLQDLTKAYGVEMLVDEATAKAVGAAQPMREIDRIAVRGRKRPEAVFEVLARGDADATGHAAYTQGRTALAERRWDDALSAFSVAIQRNPGDRPALLMLARTKALAAAPPPADWDGVWRDGLAAGSA